MNRTLSFLAVTSVLSTSTIACVDGAGRDIAIIDEGAADDPFAFEAVSRAAAVASARWGYPSRVTDAPQVAYAEIVADAAGNAHAIWDTSTALYASSYSAVTVSWSQVVRIDSAPNRNGELRATIDSSGRVIVTWQERGDRTGAVWNNRFTPGIGWSGPQALTGAGAAMDDAAGSANGDAFVVWSEPLPDHSATLYGRRYTPAGGWGATAVLDTGTAGTRSTSASIAMDAQGNATVAWVERFQELRARRFTPAAGWGSIEVLASHAGPPMVTAAAGAAIVVWMSATGDGTFHARRATSSGWEAPVALTEPGDPFPSSPTLVSNAAGSALLVWSTSQRSILARRFTASGGWTATTEVFAARAGEPLSPYFPRAALDSANRGHIVWSANIDGDEVVTSWTSGFTGNTWRPPQLLSAPLRNGADPTVSIAGNGTAFAAWVEDQWSMTGKVIVAQFR